MEIQNKIGEQVFDKLRSKFSHISLGDTEGNSTQNPEDAVFFNFNYTDNQGHDHGNITVSLIDRSMKIYYSKNISKDLEGSELSDWYKFLQDMRKTAMSNLYRFDTHDISKSNLDISDIEATVKRQDMQESKMYGSTKSSYQECGPAKVIVRHSQKIDPEVRGARSRKVESIFVETVEGERFKMPFTSLPGARAMAQHVGQGGRPYDAIGESITTLVSEIADLRPFIARNRNAVFEDETTMEMIEAAQNYYNEARATLGKIKGKRGYKNYAESFEVNETIEFNEDEAASMKDRFTRKRFSDKMEAAMPVVHKAYMNKMKPKKPADPKSPISEFEEWAESASKMQMPVTESCSSILSDEEKDIIKQWLNDETELPQDLLYKLTDHYADEIPYGWLNGDDGTPEEWLWDRMDMEYGDEVFGEGKWDYPDSMKNKGPAYKEPSQANKGAANRKKRKEFRKAEKAKRHQALMRGEVTEEEEELCSTECCGKPISQCHCGPECPHCDCHAKNKARMEESGYGKYISSAYLDKKHGKPSKWKPARQGNTIKGKGMPGKRHPGDKPVSEGTWAIPDTPEKMSKLRDILSNKLPFGPNGENASGAIYALLGDDELMDEIYNWSQRFDPEADASGVIKDWMQDNAPEFWEELQIAESLEESLVLEDEELTDSITSMIINRIARYVPEVFSRHGPEHVYNVVRDNVAWITDDWPEDEGFGSSDSYGAWKSSMEDLGIDEEEYRARVDQHMQGLAGPAKVPESRGRAPHERMHKGDVVLPKATYSDYLEVYKSSAIGGTDADDDAERMVKHLRKKGKDADHKTAKSALKRMAEMEAKEGLHIAEDLEQLLKASGLK